MKSSKVAFGIDSLKESSDERIISRVRSGYFHISIIQHAQQHKELFKRSHIGYQRVDRCCCAEQERGNQ